LDQARAKQLAESPGFTLVAGRYEGVDQRFVYKYIDEELSIGDYVLSGGELAAMVVIDAVTRLLPGTLGDQASAAQDSFCDGLLDYPHYTRPEEIGDQRVPKVLLSGDHGAIAAWRRQQALGRTWLKRRDLLTALRLDPADQQLLDRYIESHRRASKHRPH
jgi:tRNA (guanine37-N1)-methyltransferase